VLATESLEDLASEGGESQRFFQKVARQAERPAMQRRLRTQQGIYLFAADGELLGYGNHMEPQALLTMLQAAAGRRSERGEGHALESSPDRLERLFPEQGLVLAQTIRILGESPVRSRRGRFLDPVRNHDFAWFGSHEIPDDWVPNGAEVGQALSLPEAIVRRLARHNFLGTARALGQSYRDEHVEIAELSATVTGLGGAAVEVELRGRIRVAQADASRRVPRRSGVTREPERGVDVRLLGRATWAREDSRFTAFELLAHGDQWGGRTGSRMDQHDLATVFRLADPENPLHRTKPAMVADYAEHLRQPR